MATSARNPLNQQTSPEYRSEEQLENDALNRHRALLTTIDYAQTSRTPATVFVDLVDVLGLEEELDDLVAGDPERQQRLDDVRTAIELSSGPGLEGS